MAKRRADKQLTRDDLDNLDNEDEEVPLQSSGGRQFASPDVLATRKLAKARRSITSDSTSKPSPFAGLKFQAPSTTTSTPLFGGTNLFQSSGSLFPKSPQLSMAGGIGSNLPNSTLTNQPQPSTTGLVNGNSTKDSQENAKAEIERKTRALNEKFVKHVSQVLIGEPGADLRPNCEEYIRYLDGLQDKVKKAIENTCEKKTEVTSESPKPSRGESSANITPIPAPNPTTFSFGPSNAQAKREIMTDFSATPLTKVNGSGLTSSTPLFGFGVNAGVPSFTPNAANIPTAPAVTQPSQETSDEPEYVPPKNENVKTEEEGAVYSKRIKLYFRDGKNYAPMGKAWMHIKPLESGRHQLIIRSENSIGSVLVNILLDPVIPLKRTKKDIQFSTMTNHPTSPTNPDSLTTVIYLMRTGCEEDAAEVEAKLNHFKSITCHTLS